MTAQYNHSILQSPSSPTLVPPPLGIPAPGPVSRTPPHRASHPAPSVPVLALVHNTTHKKIHPPNHHHTCPDQHQARRPARQFPNFPTNRKANKSESWKAGERTPPAFASSSGPARLPTPPLFPLPPGNPPVLPEMSRASAVARPRRPRPLPARVVRVPALAGLPRGKPINPLPPARVVSDLTPPVGPIAPPDTLTLSFPRSPPSPRPSPQAISERHRTGLFFSLTPG